MRTNKIASALYVLMARCGKFKLRPCRSDYLNRMIKRKSAAQNRAACALTTSMMFRGL